MGRKTKKETELIGYSILFILYVAFNAVQKIVTDPDLAGIVFGISSVLLIWGILLLNRNNRINKVKFLARQSLHNDYSAGEFEQVTAEIFQSFGFQAKVTGGADDRGIDIILTKSDQTIGVQCKRYKKAIGPAQIREFVGSLEGARMNKGYFVTTRTFTDAAWDTAKRSRINIIFYDGDKMGELQLKAKNLLNTDLITAAWWGKIDKSQRLIISGLVSVLVAIAVSGITYLVVSVL